MELIPNMRHSFQGVLGRRRDLLHRKAVWQEIVDHLSVFVDTDAAKAKHGIKCATEEMVVPQDVITSVVNEITDSCLSEIEKKLNIIDSSEVSGVEGKDEGRKKAGAKRKGRKASGAKGGHGPEGRPD